MSLVAVNGVRYEVRVDGDGPPLLLIHGFTGRGSSWQPHLPALRRVATTIVVDLLGHGRSDAPADPARHSVEHQAADMAVIVALAGHGPADVLGYSFGARVALTLAFDSPGSVRRLILESPSAGIADPEERALRRSADEDLADAIEMDGIPEFVARWEALGLFATQQKLSPARRWRLHQARLQNSAVGLSGSLRGAGQGAMKPLHDRLAAVKVPTLVIGGELDLVRSRAEYVASHIPGARLHIVPDAGHAPHIEKPTRFRAVVLPFLTATPA